MITQCGGMGGNYTFQGEDLPILAAGVTRDLCRVVEGPDMCCVLYI